MKCIILLVLWCSNGLYAQYIGKFVITASDTSGDSPVNVSCQLEGNQEVIVGLGDTVRFEPSTYYHVVNSTCRVTQQDGSIKLIQETNRTDVFVEKIATMDMMGEWSCKLHLKEPSVSSQVQLPPTNCNATVKVRGIEF